MATLNINIPRFYCLLRKEFLYDGKSHHGEFIKVCVFGVASISGRALGFHVLTENGAVVWRLPIHALCHTEDRLSESRVRTQLRDKSWAGGQYMFTLDWFGHEDAEEVGDGGHKCAHIIAEEKPDYLTSTGVWKVERETTTTAGFFYDLDKV